MNAPAAAPKRTIKLPKLHAGQQSCLSNSRRLNIVVAGEQAGKTTLAIEVLLASRHGALNSTKPVAFFTATDDDLDDVRQRVMRAIEPLVKRRPNARRLELINGGAIDFYSLERSRDAFGQYGLIVVDNARQIDGLSSLWIDTLQPLIQSARGHAWILSEAYGKRNELFSLWQDAGQDSRWAQHRFTSFDNPHLPEDTNKAAMLALEPEYQQRFMAEFLDVAFEFSAEQRIVKPGETFLQWCERLEESGLRVDGHPFTLSNRPAMRFIYELIPSTIEEAYGRMTVIMKCTQVGFTVMEMLAALYLALRFAPAKIGMFMPAQQAATGKSTGRFMPIVRSIPEVHTLMTDGKAGEGNVLTRDMGTSRFHFLWTTGKVSTESNPMDVVSFDEVQEMKIADMEKTRERLSASALRYTLMGSTANWPDEDIHHWFKRGTQYKFHTQCPSCGQSQVMDEHFPECIGYDEAAPRLNAAGAPIIQANGRPVLGEYRYRCVHCKGWIDDAQGGEWLPPRDKNAPIESVHFPQFLSPTISPREMIEAYHNADDMKNFFNRKLGKPYTDPSQVPVNMEMLNACAKAGMEAWLVWKTRARGTFMGLDQMGGFIVAIIKERTPSGRQAVVHLEYIYISPTKDNPDASPWDRADELMAQYGVQCCVVETLPNYDNAKSFSQRHPGKVFLAGYGNMDGEMLHWGDTPTSNASDRRTTDEAQDRWTVRLDQYKCMQVSMRRFQDKTCLFPDPQALVQEILEKGHRKTIPVCKDMAFFHFTRTALIAEKDEDEKKFKRRVVKVGIDPHTSYANMLCDVAWARAYGTSTFILPDAGPASGAAAPERLVEMPGLQGILAQAEEAMANTCGACMHMDASGFCPEIGMRTKRSSPGCWAFASMS